VHDEFRATAGDQYADIVADELLERGFGDAAGLELPGAQLARHIVRRIGEQLLAGKGDAAFQYGEDEEGEGDCKNGVCDRLSAAPVAPTPQPPAPLARRAGPGLPYIVHPLPHAPPRPDRSRRLADTSASGLTSRFGNAESFSPSVQHRLTECPTLFA